MAEGVDALMNPVEAARPQTMPNRSAANAEPPQLSRRDDPVLARRQLRNTHLPFFCTHTVQKNGTPRNSPRRSPYVPAVSGGRKDLPLYVVIPPNWPPVTFSTWPCT